jgi:hypothetical protein
MGKSRKVWKITETPHVINLINRFEKKRRININIYIKKEEKGNPKAAKSKTLPAFFLFKCWGNYFSVDV